MRPSEALETLKTLQRWFLKYSDYYKAITVAISALEMQEQTCDTCRHGRFGDRQCDNCGVRYPNHYKAEEEA